MGKMAHGIDGVTRFTELMVAEGLNEVLDIGSGEEQTHANYMKKHGLLVDTIDFFEGSTIVGNYNDETMPHFYEGIHAAHVLEHQLNVNSFLKKVHWDLQENGFLCITVPPLKHRIVGGHVSLWNAGLILYNLVLARFDCSNARIKTYGYNISVIIRKKTILDFPKLLYTGPDLANLHKYFPPGLKYLKHGQFEGDIKLYNW
jgi:hypothetical protein